jgi:hypothetical protein
MKKNGTALRGLIAYYGLLQTLHLLVLIRTGIILLQGSEAPFPILPPPGGWQEQSMAFMFGLAGMDVLGIMLGIFFSYQTIIKEQFMPILGILSLTIFITGAVVFGAGTFPSGAWAANPLAYWIMVALFAPSPLLLFKLLKFAKQ